MVADSHTEIDGLTLPELITAAELAGRRLKEHVQYDLLVKTKTLACDPQPDVMTILQSRDFLVRLYERWQQYNDAIQQRIQRILQGS